MPNGSKKMESLYNLLAEETFNMPDDQFLQELEEIDQTTAKSEADKIKNIFANSLSEFQLNNRKNTITQKNKVPSPEITELLSKKLDEKIKYIKNLLEECKTYGLPLPTLQFRNLDQLTNEDANLILTKLAENGLIDSIKKAKNE